MNPDEQIFALLDDLNAEADAAFGAQQALEIADQARAEYGTVTLNARLMAAVGSEVTLDVVALGTVQGRLSAVASSWLLLRMPQRAWVIPTAALLSCDGAPSHAVAELAWPRTAQLGLGSVLRRMADSGDPVQLVLRDGARLTGGWRRVGADFAELASAEGRRLVLVPFAAIAAVAQVASAS
ncbi:hypothetical protein ACLM5J_13215 [Nocardioides sp. Bht2]|uniref:hypothetical protein n=1 Tax=Nocardioides sp. Bht2 TaxID=3392297 RepID=UPI0039B3D039